MLIRLLLVIVLSRLTGNGFDGDRNYFGPHTSERGSSAKRSSLVLVACFTLVGSDVPTV